MNSSTRFYLASALSCMIAIIAAAWYSRSASEKINPPEAPNSTRAVGSEQEAQSDAEQRVPPPWHLKGLESHNEPEPVPTLHEEAIANNMPVDQPIPNGRQLQAISLPLALAEPGEEMTVTQNQLDKLDQVRAEFLEALGPNPSLADPGYAARWRTAQHASDERLQALLGWDAYLALYGKLHEGTVLPER